MQRPAPPDNPGGSGRQRSGPARPQPNVVAPAKLDRSVRFWIIILATGVCGGLAGGLLMRLLHLVQHLAWSYASGSFLEAAGRTSPAHRIAVTFLAGVLVATGLIALRFGKGGHAQEISVAIWFKAGEAPLLRTLARGALSITIVAMGAAVGREGALKQAGAAFADRFASWARLDAPARRLITACGAGAGLAAAYDLPLGGGLFALEVLLGTLELPFAVPAIACSIIGTIVSWLLLPMRPTYVTPTYPLNLDQIAWAVLIGPVAGLLAIPYVRLMAWSRLDHPRRPFETVGMALLVLTGLGVASVWAPQLLGNGRGVVQLMISGAAAPLWFVAILLLARPVATALCLKSGAPGGLFTPTITFGAVLGDLLGRIWAGVIPNATSPHGGYAVIAAGAFLAACTSAPLSAIVIMLELGSHIDLLIVPMSLAAVAAALTARLVRLPSIYSATAEVLEARARRKPGRGNAAISRDRTVAPAAEKLSGVLVLLARASGPVYLVDQAGRPQGRLERERLAHYLTGADGLPLTTAGDVADPVGPVCREGDVERGRAGEAREGTVVVEDESGVFVGVVEAG